MKKIALLLVLGSFMAITVDAQTKTRQCRGARRLDPNEVSINNCSGGVCKLKRKTDAIITLKITPDREIKELTTSVQAMIGQFPFPFVGVDGQSACNNIYDESGKKVGCPLQKGKTYIYKNQFAVLEIYPKIQLLVHWALKSGNNVISCFEIPARIV